MQIPEIFERQGCLIFRQRLHSSAPQAGHGPGVAGNRAPDRQRCGQAAFLRSDERRGQETPSGHFIVVCCFLRGRKFGKQPFFDSFSARLTRTWPKTWMCDIQSSRSSRPSSARCGAQTRRPGRNSSPNCPTSKSTPVAL